MYKYLGFAFRLCDQNGAWRNPNVSECQTIEQITLERRAEELNTLITNTFTDNNRDVTQSFMPESLVNIASELKNITNMSTSILPNDVSSTANTLDIIIS